MSMRYLFSQILCLQLISHENKVTCDQEKSSWTELNII